MVKDWLDKHWPNWRWWGEFITNTTAVLVALAIIAHLFWEKL